MKKYLKKAIAFVSEAWNGASKSKITFEGYNPSKNDINDDIFNEIGILRTYCSDLTRNNGFAAGIINTKVTSVVGSGLKMKPLLTGKLAEYSDKVESEFNLWAEDKYECDGYGELTFYEIQDLYFRTILTKGDCFVRFGYSKNPGCRNRFKLYLIDPDRVSNPNYKMNSDTVKNGIKYHEKSGRAIGFYYSTGKINKTWQFQPYLSRLGRVLAIHGTVTKTIGQSRGIPDLAPVITLIKQLGDFTDAYLQKAIVSAILSVFVKSEDGMGLQGLGSQSMTESAHKRFKLGSGTVLQGSVEDSVEVIESKTPSDAFDPFTLSIVRQIGIGVELPYEILIKHFTSSYTASQAAFLEVWRYYKRKRSNLISSLCNPTYQTWFEIATIDNILPFENYLYVDKITKREYTNCEWIGEPQGHINQLISNKADGYAEEMGWVSGSYNAAVRGQNWSKVNLRRQQEQEFLREKGLKDEESSKTN